MLCWNFEQNSRYGQESDPQKVIPSKIEKVKLPEQVDMIISERMSYMLYNERMLETYIHARKVSFF